MNVITPEPVVSQTASAPLTINHATQRWTTPFALGAAGVLAVGAFALHPQSNGDDQAFVASLNGHMTRWAASHVLEAIVFICLLVGSGAVMRLARGRGFAGKVTAIGVVTMAIGSIAAIFETIGHGFLAYALAGRRDVSVALSTRIQLDFAKLPWSSPMFMGSLVAQVGILLIALGLLGSRAVPRWTAVLLLLSPVSVMFAGAGAAAVIGLLPLAIALTSIARRAVDA